MKKINLIIAVLLISIAFFAGCSLQLEERKFSKDKTEVYIDIRDSSGNARTALPDFDFDIFKYTLTATKDGTAMAEPIISNTSYSTFNDALGIEPGVYVFTLTGKNSDNKAVLQGVSNSVDLTNGSAVVQFRMYPLSGDGLTGKAEITVNLPNDGTIKSVKACISESITSLPETFTTIEVTGSKVVYTANNVSAGKKQYAVLFFYDNNGGCISSVYESLIIVAGQTSKATRTISSNMYHKYQVNIKFITTDDNKITSVFTTKTLTVKGNDGKNYTMTLGSDGSFGAMLPEQSYTVIYNGVDTGISFDSPSYVDTITFKKITLPTGGVELTDIKKAVLSEDKTYVLVPEMNSEFNATVKVKDGYSVTGSSVVINGVSVSDGETVSVSSASGSINASGVSPIVYNISYVLNGGSFKYNYTEPVSYTVENYPALPVISNVDAPNGKFLDGWKLNGSLCANIPEGTTGDISLEAVYKEGIKVVEGTSKLTEEEIAAGAKGVIYASGHSLIVKWRDWDSTVTEVYYDYNGNGEKDSEDTQLGAWNSNYSDYILKAGNEDGSPVASDFTFTVKGGKIAALIGLGKDELNKSTVNISGESIIGDGSTIGIDLASLTNEKVNIVGQMTGSYSITLLSEHAYDPNRNCIVADINNSDYAQLKNFICIPKGDARNSEYVTNENGKLLLKLSSKTSAGRTFIYLFNSKPIALPSGAAGSENGILWEQDGDQVSNTAFTLGESANINQECSVFSISVNNGTFKIKPSTDGSDPTKMVDLYGNIIETDNLCQYKSGEKISYRAKTNTSGPILKANEKYVYIHMFSQSNEITSEAASKFLKNIIFIKDDPNVDIDVTVNLETVSYDDIKNIKENGVSFTIKNQWGGTESKTLSVKAFDYYNGSFYLGVDMGAWQTIDWITAYNYAKASKFNGLNGYLVTITSEVENNYIDACMGLNMSWTGGSRMVPAGNIYDATEFKYDPNTKTIRQDNKTLKDSNNSPLDGRYYGTDFVWQCGPDAGKVFTTGKFTYTTNNRTSGTITGYTSTGVPEGSYANWESVSLGDEGDEPNNYNNLPENTVQFHSKGRWNDLPYNINVNNPNYAPQGFIIEFSPYEYNGFVNEANKKNITLTASY